MQNSVSSNKSRKYGGKIKDIDKLNDLRDSRCSRENGQMYCYLKI